MRKKEITSNVLRKLYQDFFKEHKHVVVQSAPLVPENDPSSLFVMAGMHPLLPYLKGESHPSGNRLVNSQKCLRTIDIDDVGDRTHATVFEMLGNWSLGDYFKQEMVQMTWEFLTSEKWLGINPDYLAITVFAGDKDAPADTEVKSAWLEQGVLEARIAMLGKKDNWWPAGGGNPGLQGPDTEIFYWTGEEKPPTKFDPNNIHWVEIWNNVFIQYNFTDSGKYEQLKQKSVDTGVGLERVVMVLNGYDSIYEIDTYRRLMKEIGLQAHIRNKKDERIVADHIKASSFIMCDERPVAPSNTEQGYVLRRLIRRMVMKVKALGIEDYKGLILLGMDIIVSEYENIFSSFTENIEEAKKTMLREIDKFENSLKRGLKKVDEIIKKSGNKKISGQDAFFLWESFGFPIELTVEIAKEKDFSVDTDGFASFLKNHQEKSRTASAGKFKGGLSDTGEETTRYHTATHLLQQALREVLGDHVTQRGSNINAERLRFDFSHPAKLTDVEKQRVQDLVNKKIAEKIDIKKEETTVKKAKERGALGVFQDKYGEKVSVYSIGDFSCEICGGPHVENTEKLGTFEIIKEESVSAGTRRIKAILK